MDGNKRPRAAFSVGFPTQDLPGRTLALDWNDMAQVLIVDDEPEILELIRDALKARGLEVKSALTDTAALELLEKEARETAVLVTDINLGKGVTGFDIARRARALNPALTVVYITGNPDHLQRFGVQGAHLIEKPLRADELAEKLVTIVQPRA